MVLRPWNNIFSNHVCKIISQQLSKQREIIKVPQESSIGLLPKLIANTPSFLLLCDT
jgi:hypothetical protein